LQQKCAADNPYDRHTLGGVIDATEKLTGCAIEQASVPVT
jgi:transposase, IS5 family